MNPLLKECLATICAYKDVIKRGGNDWDSLLLWFESFRTKLKGFTILENKQTSI
jgi:hypothetical protein